MSAISGGSRSGPGFDFWEFVHCTRCRLPFSSGSNPTIPFWLTECGHIICNSHLNADQSCATCGAQKIQLVPLQREVCCDIHMFSIIKYLG
ncbi:hypothetical protein BD779DRAFT_1509345 [Infundibulicybe gibba]|nr:hypothetical protein BD779DRAFT_1509345 [Infundibulicybe gibba]